MVHCPKCQAENSSAENRCSQCGAGLLPGKGIPERLKSAGGGLAAGLFGAALIYVFSQMEEPPPCCLSPEKLALGVVILPIMGIVDAVRKPPLHERYVMRARRHVDMDPEQAVADFGRALELAPEKTRAALLKERAALYEKLGMEEESVRDQLAYTLTPGAHEEDFGTSVVKMLGGDAGVYAAGASKDERKRLVSEGKIKALGYCPTCQEVVELDGDLRCPVAPKHAKPRAVRFVMPDQVEGARQEVRREFEQSRRTRRTYLVVVGAVIGVLILLCIACGVLSQINRP
jgi:hypothetical protein